MEYPCWWDLYPKCEHIDCHVGAPGSIFRHSNTDPDHNRNVAMYSLHINCKCNCKPDPNS